jgi:glucosamine 6-phosphate synthetase-like amidotransferase/phosphosugar isomerase protein
MGLRLIILVVMQDKGLLAVSVGTQQSRTVYYFAINRGYDPDKPRNLAKSVTVK